MKNGAYYLAALVIVPLGTGVSSPVQAQEPAPAVQVAKPPELASIDYKLLYRRLMQLGMLSQVLGYSLSVDADGKATDCRFSRRFKSRYTRDQLCTAFMESTRFHPARGASGAAVGGTYEGEIEIASFFQPSR